MQSDDHNLTHHVAMRDGLPNAIRPTLLGQMIKRRAANNAAADDDHTGLGWKITHGLDPLLMCPLGQIVLDVIVIALVRDKDVLGEFQPGRLIQ